MIYKAIFLLAMLFAVLQSQAQVEIVITELRATNIEPRFSDDEISEDIENGPHVLLYATLINNSKESIILRPSKALYYLVFNYSDKSYRKEIFPLAFSDYDRVELEANQKIEFSVDALIFLGTPLFEEKKDNYTMELLRTLPTLKLILKQPGGLKITSTSIEKVTIK
jgi:hypothetical protein